MKDNLQISDLINFSKELYNKNKNHWTPLEPKYAKNSILYMIEEIGEVIAILKKKKTTQYMKKGKIRNHLIEEMSDILMYYTDTLNRFGITAEELSKAYQLKHKYNMNRDFKKDHEKYLEE